MRLDVRRSRRLDAENVDFRCNFIVVCSLIVCLLSMAVLCRTCGMIIAWVYSMEAFSHWFSLWVRPTWSRRLVLSSVLTFWFTLSGFDLLLSCWLFCRASRCLSSCYRGFFHVLAASHNYLYHRPLRLL